MKFSDTAYPAKLLLFGEYSVLGGGQALAIPVFQYFSQLSIDKIKSAQQREHWQQFYQYLLTEVNNIDGIDQEGLQAMSAEIEQGLYFDSNIAMGYGLGSSGSLVAAVYDRYFKRNSNPDISPLKQTLAQMEAFFHGSSSGMDPLVSFNKKPLLRCGDSYREIELPVSEEFPFSIYLLDSGERRSTAKMVGIFHTLQENAHNNSTFQSLMSASDHAIHWFLLRQWDLFWENLTCVSEYQWAALQLMIHPAIRGVWKQSLISENIQIKLCGAGGGGYYLLFVKGEFNDVQTRLNSLKIPFIPVKI